MKTITSFEYLIDDVFGELEGLSHAEIDCLSEPVETPQGHFRDIVVKAVNGHTCSRNYLNFTEHLRHEALERLREILPTIATVDLEPFLEQARRRIRHILRAVKTGGDLPGTDLSTGSFRWSERRVRCRLNGKTTNHPLVLREAIRKSRRFALIFYLSVKKLEERVRSITLITFPDTSGKSSLPVRPVYKFKMNCPMSMVAGLLRVMTDRGFIAEPNVAELCRRMTGSLCTARKDSFSVAKFRYCFDNPNPDMLEKLLYELRSWEKYLASLIDRLRQ